MNAALMTFEEFSLFPDIEMFPGRDAGFTSVSIDSRQIKPGALFVALIGAVQDGHKFIEAALAAGAAGIMAARSRLDSFDILNLVKKWGKTLLVAEDTLRCLQKTAKIYLEKFPNLLKIAITGSSGKTTTKEIAAAIIGQEKNTIMNSGNMNSETGLPLSVFNVRSEHEVGIFEAGMNRRGEIAELAEVLKPNIALITNIGSAHIGILGSTAAIAEEKKNIFSQFSGKQKALIPSGDPFRSFLCEGVAGEVRLYGNNDFPELELVSEGIEGLTLKWAGEPVNFPLPGVFNLRNIVSALAIAREIPVSDKAVRKGLESVKPLFGRSEILKGNVTVIRDCYNSNPESLEEVLSSCDSFEWRGRKVYVIGSMLELGDISEEAHVNMGRRLAASKADLIFLYGVETEKAAEVLVSCKIPFYRTVEMNELRDMLKTYINSGDLVLVKGSRGCAMEELTGVLLPDFIPAGGH